jgi:endonuclease III
MSYTESDVEAAAVAMEKYRISEDAEVSAALAVVGLSSQRAAKEAQIRDDMIRVAHRTGASLRQLAEVSGLGRKTVTAVVSSDPDSTTA